jgi:hypothetical protein
VVVDLQADGQIEGAHAFMLEKPPRLVVDLPEMKSAVTQTRFEVGHGIVKAVRVGQHDGKVRVVVDGADEAKSFSEKMAAQPGGLLLALAGAELPAMAEAMPVVADAAGGASEPAKQDEAAPADAMASAESAPAAPPRRAPARRRWFTACSSIRARATIVW